MPVRNHGLQNIKELKMLTIKQEVKDNIEIITLSGILNADTSPTLEDILEKAAEKPEPRILMFIPELTYISSAGIGCFIGVIKKIRTKGGDIRFVRMDTRVLRVFSLLDMTDFFKTFDSLEKGMESYSA